MNSDFFESSISALEKRYSEALILHDARLKSNSLKIEQLTADKKKLQLEVDQLRHELKAVVAQCEVETNAASKDAELTELQLHQVQEELEHYFLLCRYQADILSSSENLVKRTSTMLSGVIQ